jgi:hypothetical protein
MISLKVVVKCDTCGKKKTFKRVNLISLKIENDYIAEQLDNLDWRICENVLEESEILCEVCSESFRGHFHNVN